MKRLSIRAKLILVLSSVLVLAFVSTSLISYFVSKKYFRSSALDETLPLISNNILSEIQIDLMMPIHISSLMTNDTFLKDWALAGEKDVAQVTKYLKEIKDKYGFFTAFYVSEPTGRHYYYDGILKTVSLQDPHDVWYYDFIKKNVDVDLDIDTNEASAGNLTIFINHRLVDYEGRFLGVTGVGLNMDQIGGILSEYQTRFNRLIYLVDSNGLVQIHPDKSLVEKASLTDMEGLKAIAPDILKNQADSATYEFDRDGRHVLLAARYFPGFDWYLIVEQVEDDDLGEIRSIMFTNLAVGLLVTCLIIVIVVLAVNYFQGRLEYLATVDELTGVANRRQLMRELKNEMDRAARYGHPVSLLMIDVDRFKSINDNYGHLAGDKVLVILAETIQSSLRGSDMLGRLGGEEFAAILPEADLDEAVIVANRVRAEVETRTLDTEQGLFQLTVSLGVAMTYAGSSEIEDLLQRADLAMYQAKENGRNQVCAAKE